MILRQWRPLAILIVWLLLVVLAILFSPRPKLPAWSAEAAEDTLLRTLGLAAEPTLLVFHRPGGLTPDDQSEIAEFTADPAAAGQVSEPSTSRSGETAVLSAMIPETEIPTLRARLPKDRSGPESHVTGATALAHDSVDAWEQNRPWVLLGIVALTALVTLLGRFGVGHKAVIVISAGIAGTVTSALTALVAPALPVALATTISAGLAGAGAVRLVLAAPFMSRTPFAPRNLTESVPEEEPEAAAPGEGGSPLQHVLIAAGEMTLVQAFVAIVGLAGFLFDYRAGAAVLIGLLVASSVSLSASPALATLMAPRPLLRPSPGKVLRPWVRLALAILPIVGFLWLTPTAHPTDSVAPRADSAAGYRLLLSTGAAADDPVAPGRLWPLRLSIQAPEANFTPETIAALQELVAELRARPALAAVEGDAALLQLSAGSEISSTLLPILSRLQSRAMTITEELAGQAGALSQVSGDLAQLDLIPDVDPLRTTLDGAAARLEQVRSSLSGANAAFARIPAEFPEVASRIDHVPTLRMLPDTLESAVTELRGASDALREALTQTLALANNPANAAGIEALAQAQSRLDASADSLAAMAADIAALRQELQHIETLWVTATAGGDEALARNNVLNLTLIPTGDPYAQRALDEAQALRAAVAERLRSGPLAKSVVVWSGASTAAAALRAQALNDLLLRGAVLAIVAVALAAWGTLSRLGPTLLVALGAALSAAAGLGVAAVVLRQIDAGALALAAVALAALSAGRLMIGRAPAVEDLALALPPLTLAISGVPALTAVGLALGAGLLANSFLVVPTLIRRPQRPDREKDA